MWYTLDSLDAGIPVLQGVTAPREGDSPGCNPGVLSNVFLCARGLGGPRTRDDKKAAWVRNTHPSGLFFTGMHIQWEQSPMPALSLLKGRKMWYTQRAVGIAGLVAQPWGVTAPHGAGRSANLPVPSTVYFFVFFHYTSKAEDCQISGLFQDVPDKGRNVLHRPFHSDPAFFGSGGQSIANGAVIGKLIVVGIADD